jgi:Intein splicing domain/Terminase large subunit, T4likevirus-type, N-terminal
MPSWADLYSYASAVEEEILQTERSEQMLLFHPKKGFQPNQGGQQQFFEWFPLQQETPDMETLFKGRWTSLVGGIGCLAGETLVTVDGKQVEIRSITNKVGSKVNTLFGEMTTSPAYIKGQADLYRVTLRSGKSAIATLDHKFLTLYGWEKLRSLTEGKFIACHEAGRRVDTLATFTTHPKVIAYQPDLKKIGITEFSLGHDDYWDKIVSIEFVRYDDFYDLHVPFANHYEAQGIWHHNSGKTHCGAIWAILRSLWFPNYRGLISANSFPQLYSSTLIGLIEACRKYNIPLTPWRDSVEENAIAIANARRCFVGKHRAFWRVLSIGAFTGKTQTGRGAEYQQIWLDEGAYAPEQGFQTLDGRLRSSHGYLCQGLITTSPAGFNWLYRRFADPSRTVEMQRVYHMLVCRTLENRAHLGDDYVASLTANYTDALAAQELDAEFINSVVGRIYKKFARHVNGLTGVDAKMIAYKPALALHIAFDFNATPCVAVIAQQVYNEVHVFKEFFLLDADIDELCKDMCTWIELLRPQNKDLYLYGDASGRARSAVSKFSAWDIVNANFKKTGLEIHKRYPASNPPVRDRVNAVNFVFRDQECFIDVDNCPELITDLEVLDFSETGGIDKSDSLRSHLSDALGYLIYQLYGAKKLPAGMNQKRIVGVPL